MTDSQTLLADFVETGSEEGFRELVSRYVNLVYFAALRIVGGDAHLAQDVAQTVFSDLARLARTLPGEVMLGGWLHRHTCFVALNTLRGERRRQLRERQAMEMHALQPEPEADLSRIMPILDAAINELAEPERKAILLRFFEQQEFRRIGQATGCNEDAARMRVKRGLEKLEWLLKKRGVTSTAAALSAALTANAAQAAPTGLAATISSAALAGSAGCAAGVIGATKTIAMTTLQKTLMAGTIAVLAAGGVYQARLAAHLRGENEALELQQTQLAEQIQQLQRLHAESTNLVAGLRAENLRLNADTNQSELLKLRGEVGVLQQQRHELEQWLSSLQATSGKTPPEYSTNELSRESWGFAGYDTPEAAFQSCIWAKSAGEEKLWLSCLSTNMVEDLQRYYVQGKSDRERAEFLKNETKHWLSLQVLKEIPLNENTVLLQTAIGYEKEGKTGTHVSVQEMKKNDGKWIFVQEFN